MNLYIKAYVVVTDRKTWFDAKVKYITVYMYKFVAWSILNSILNLSLPVNIYILFIRLLEDNKNVWVSVAKNLYVKRVVIV
jgi:hypothetical protein